MVAELPRLGGCEALTDSEWRSSIPHRGTDSSLSAASEGPRRVSVGQGRGEWDIAVSGNPAWFEPTLYAMGALLVLPEDWDTYGAPRIEPEYLRAAMELLCSVMRDDVPAPSLVPTSRGGVQLEWHMRGVDLEIEFISPSRVRGFYEDQESDESWEADLSFDLRRLTSALARLSEQ